MAAKKDVLALPTRRAIFDCIRQCPGAHLRGIEREVQLPFGQVLYHLDYLERHGYVVTRRDGGFKRYFVSNVVGRQEKTYIALLRHEIPRKVTVLLLLQPDLTHRELTDRLPVSGSTLSFHLAKMAEAGVLERADQGSEHRFRVADERTAAKVLVYWRESWEDSLVDRFADVWLGACWRPAEDRLARVREDPALAARLRGALDGGALARAILGVPAAGAPAATGSAVEAAGT